MAWFRHHYHCDSCQGSWLAEAEVAVEADCPFCRERDVFPYKSDDRTVVIEEHQGLFVILEAMKAASRRGDYRKLKSFATRNKAEAFISGRLRRVS
jgi:hypothetical protein